MFLADESVDREVVERLRRDGHDVLYVAEIGQQPGRIAESMRVGVLSLAVTLWSCAATERFACPTSRDFETGPACVPDLQDRDLDAAGLQPGCPNVELPGMVSVPYCDGVGSLPCWELRDTPGVCPDEEQPYFIVVVQDNGETAPAHIYCVFDPCP